VLLGARRVNCLSDLFSVVVVVVIGVASFPQNGFVSHCGFSSD
jgi:hypothetical protein